jgi:threonylcarbamoyladenosine tRNA methylthiotransferase MtaB
MPTAAFANLGCKVNQYETDKIVDSFVARGFSVTDFDAPADVYVINTCSVTSAADRKSRQMARRAARQKDGAKVVLTGCFAQLALDTDEHVDGAALLVPNREKMRVAEHTLNRFPELMGYSASPANLTSVATSHAVFPEQAGLIGSAEIVAALPKRLTHTRATLKVQDGCVHFCAFCSIPHTRTTMASRPLADVVAEARRMADSGVREVVVTGVCVGAYADETSGATLSDLLAAVAQTPGLARVRLSSLQPIETDAALIDTLASHATLCPHLHLSLQSGDDTILARMRRPYDTAYYRDLVRRLRARIPDIAITTDIIVGFPGEARDLFENTLRYAAEIGFSRVHVFRYSPRERTHAARELRDDVTPAEKESRHRELSEACAVSRSAFAARYVGKWVDVLVEGRGGSEATMSGYTGAYVRVRLPAGEALTGKIVRARIAEIAEDADAIADRIEYPSQSIERETEHNDRG